MLEPRKETTVYPEVTVYYPATGYSKPVPVVIQQRPIMLQPEGGKLVLPQPVAEALIRKGSVRLGQDRGAIVVSIFSTNPLGEVQRSATPPPMSKVELVRAIEAHGLTVVDPSELNKTPAAVETAELNDDELIALLRAKGFTVSKKKNTASKETEQETK